MPRIVPADSRSIAAAAETLRGGGVVAFPTETVYGLGACTFHARALERVYDLKGRPADNPLIAHVSGAAQAREIVAPGVWTDRCDMLAAKFWPGPLTLVLTKAPGGRVPERATAGLPTIAVRSPRHPVARGLLEAVGEPVSAPSANRSGRVSPTRAQHVFDEFADVAEARNLMILDGGACEVGIESTVLDVTASPPRILRHGSVTLEQLRLCIGDVESPEIGAQQASPGTSPSHYAPRTPVELPASGDLQPALRRHTKAGHRCVTLVFDPEAVESPHVALTMPQDAAGYAHDLYQRLREADALGCHTIVIQSPADDSQAWRAVHDRLRRAAART
jgi:L-threonylcarbamoyladenylate synthase